MDSPFIYYRYVTGKNFFGRREDCKILGNLLAQGEHVVLCEPPKAGKTSVIQQTLLNLRVTGRQFTFSCEIRTDDGTADVSFSLST